MHRFRFQPGRIVAKPVLAGVVAALSFLAAGLRAQDVYKAVPGWGQQLPNGMKWGETSGMAIDAKGTVFAFTRAEPPIVELSPAGQVLRTWGDKMFVWPHGIRFDRDGNMWLTDGQNDKDGKNGQLVYKLSPDHKILMTIGTKGVAGEGEYTFNGPTDVAFGRNGDIFVYGRGYGRPRERAGCEVYERRKIHQGLGEEGYRSRRVQPPALGGD